MNALHWRTHLSPVLSAALLLGAIVWLVVLYRRHRRRHPARSVLALWLPKAVIVILVMLGTFDPVWRLVQDPDHSKKVLVLVDRSSSMDVVDTSQGARSARAGALVTKLERGLRPKIDCEVMEFDREVYEANGPTSADGLLRETDLGNCLLTVAEKPNISNYMGAVLVTDGGDELASNARLPEMPVYVVGVGSEPETWNDVAVARVEAPTIVEKDSDFEVAAEIVIRSAETRFAESIQQLKVMLEQRSDREWVLRDSRDVPRGGLSQPQRFTVRSDEEGGRSHYRVRIRPVADELSELNNVRQFAVDVRANSLSVLLFAQEVGWDFGTIRRELTRDPAVALTTLFRVSKDRFVIQDSRQQGDQGLDAGFPSSLDLLGLYRCVILGSFPASQWQPDQMQALVEYVRKGGAVVFLGGESSFAQGQYGGTALDPLFPWRLETTAGPMQTGRFTVNVPLTVTQHPIVSKITQLLAQSSANTIESLNATGSLRAGGISLMETAVGGKTIPVVALQRFGEGHSLAIATDTLWKWKRGSATLGEAYSHFVRQAVRSVSQWEEGQRFLSVRWDQPHYRPGEQAAATITVAGRHDAGQLHLRATLDAGEGTEPAPVETILSGDEAFKAQMVFPRRGEYRFGLDAYKGDELLESYAKEIAVGPTVNEGANLEVDHAFLDYLAGRTGGAYFREGAFDTLIETLRGRGVEQATTVDMPLVQHKSIYVILFVGICSLEWILRRRMNLF